jgi:hypothetical protein
MNTMAGNAAFLADSEFDTRVRIARNEMNKENRGEDGPAMMVIG